MSKTWDVVVIGAGASGYAAAVTARQKGAETLLLDASAKTARKVSASGNGRCNLSNLHVGVDCYRTDDPATLGAVLSADPQAVPLFFADLGVLTQPDDEGRVYPWSNRAASVTDALYLKADELGVARMTDEVKEVLPTKGGYVVRCAIGSVFARAVVVAVGSPASPTIGGRDNPWLAALAEVRPFLPALCPLKTDKKYFSLKGVRTFADLTLFDGDAPIAREKGEVLFGEGTLSGIAVMQLSLSIPIARRPHISLDLFPTLSEEELYRMLSMRRKGDADKLFVGLCDKPIAYTLLKEEGIGLSQGLADLTPDQIRALAHRAKNWSFGVTGTTGFDHAQVALGGVKLSSVYPNMESKTHPGLFFAGEVLDVTGVCGGFNLHWAWTSGIVAGRSAFAFCHLT